MIIITGASRGIGKFLLEKYISEKNEKVIGIYNSTQPLPQYEKYYIKLDLLNFNSVSEWIESMRDEFIDLILLNCAGNNYNSFAHKSDMKSWKNVIDLNLVATFNLIREILPIMREKKYGRVINFSSIVAQTSIPGTSSYAASKAGLWGMSRAIAAENSTKGITINNLNLGYYDIGMITEVPEKLQSRLKEKIPTGNFGNPENIYNAVRFLITSDYVNGSSIDMNGGLH
jgi:NAD(P)-dependent dehydrogenase (short-subunit alcohol dehydrogenase family)